MRKRRFELTVDRPDWRDENMPVIGKSGREIDHKKMIIKANMAMQSSIEPKWRDDPTYNLRKGK